MEEFLRDANFTWSAKHECWVSNKTYFGIGCGDDKKAHIRYDNEDGICLIEMHVNRGGAYTLFDGIIKNTKQMKQVLKMVRL